jgi:hypothetical protein
MKRYRVHWRYVTKVCGSYEGSETFNAVNEDEAIEKTMTYCRAKGLSSWSGTLTIINTELTMSEKLTQQEKYDLHLQSWVLINYKPSKREQDELQYLYKVGKYAPKTKKEK